MITFLKNTPPCNIPPYKMPFLSLKKLINSFMGKVDTEAAFRIIPISPTVRLSMEGSYFMDVVLPTGSVFQGTVRASLGQIGRISAVTRHPSLHYQCQWQ